MRPAKKVGSPYRSAPGRDPTLCQVRPPSVVWYATPPGSSTRCPFLAYVGAVTAQPCWGVVKTIDVLSPWNDGSETFSQLAPPSVVTKRKCKAPVSEGPVKAKPSDWLMKLRSMSSPQICTHPGSTVNVQFRPPSVERSMPAPLVEPSIPVPGGTTPTTSWTGSHRSLAPMPTRAPNRSPAPAPLSEVGVMFRQWRPASVVK